MVSEHLASPLVAAGVGEDDVGSSRQEEDLETARLKLEFLEVKVAGLLQEPKVDP